MAQGDNWWTSWDEVPQSVRDYPYNNKKLMEARDPELLRSLNEYFNPRPAPKERKKLELNGQGDRVMCVGDNCKSTIPKKRWREGTQLCPICIDLIKQLGQVGHIRYIGGDSDKESSDDVLHP
jgi:hypothetical protein